MQMQRGKLHLAVNGGHVIKSQTGIISICAAVQLIITQAVVSECERPTVECAAANLKPCLQI